VVGGVFTIVAAGLLLTQLPRFAERVAAAPGSFRTPIPSLGHSGSLYPGRPGHEGSEARAYLQRAAQLERDLRLDPDDFDLAIRMMYACLAVAERDFIVGPVGAKRALRKAAWALAAARRGADPDTDGPYLAMLEARWRLLADPGNDGGTWRAGYGGYGPPRMVLRDAQEAQAEITRLRARTAENPQSSRNWRRLGWAYGALARGGAGTRPQPFDAEPPLRGPGARQALAAAEEALREALVRARSPEGRRLAYSGLARIYRFQGRNDAERDALEKAVRIRPTLRRDWERLSDVYRRERDFIAARRALAAAAQCEWGLF
jgi:tetratricopeptide (TPR) repeat protein